MNTTEIFYSDPYIYECEATVTGCRKTEAGFEITFSRTCFFPEGGGHPFDTGTVNGAHITAVYERGGQIVHIASLPLAEGARAALRVDSERRLRAMRIHTAEHIVSGIILREFGFKNIGFHMDLSGAVIDIDGELTEADIIKTECAANAVIRENRAVHAYFPDDDELNASQARKLPADDRRVRMVVIDGVDACGCCGLHVSSAGQIGIIKLISARRHRGGTRIEMLAGEAALEDYQKKHTAAAAAAARFSTDISGIEASLCRQSEQISQLKRELAQKNNRIVALTAEKLLAESETQLFCIAVFDGDARALCDKLAEKKAAVVFSPSSGGTRYCAICRQGDIREACSKLHGKLGGKGGGRADFCQGAIPGCAPGRAADVMRRIIWEYERCF